MRLQGALLKLSCILFATQSCCRLSFSPRFLPSMQVRHGPHMYACQLSLEPGGGAGHVVLGGNDQGLAAGQYAVFYQDGACLGSAVIAG